jgi:CheY-like chemotaxis protein
MGNVSLGLECLPRTHPACAFLGNAVNAMDSAALLTRQMLAYTGKGRFAVETIDLSDVVREINSLVQGSISKGVQFLLNLEQHAIVDADSAQIRQLVMNLVTNAAEAIGDGKSGTVFITTTLQETSADFLRTCLTQGAIQPGRFVLLEIRDTGCGMDEAILSRIFDPFFSTKFTGRGLGLAAVLGIVNSHKGALKVESTPGAGTTFKVLFPASAQPAPVRETEQTEPGLAGAGAILVVDDEEMVRRTVQDSLERYGYAVKLAASGAEALAIFEQEPDAIALVLLDLTMPGMSGEDTFQHLRSIRPGVKVVLSTGFSETEATRRFADKSLAGFLQKPYTVSQLAECIKSVISSRHAPGGRLGES